MRSLVPQFAKDPSRIPGSLDKFGLGFAINTKPVDGGRSSGSLAWAGIYNTFFWIDPPRRTCGIIMMQLLPLATMLRSLLSSILNAPSMRVLLRPLPTNAAIEFQLRATGKWGDSTNFVGPKGRLLLLTSTFIELTRLD